MPTYTFSESIDYFEPFYVDEDDTSITTDHGVVLRNPLPGVVSRVVV